ncbi:uncharacterized protein MYCGRDRAFT_97986 [Zymoseptoria tritici IPO323]|uniref:Uncharacterized protein n=1 Tax=Zymoseptoria tritici (strain CBS 115943 / IPO323) TaxID=336722 RepID=F9XRZ6_ZYMTI|nr:uncharacterized protein MYCGRDRAFT_97986 [Zymoseptoria tritici IPO323]EGP82008.1 hypothetical protein MYCGRDRAFT_97986 [Zymoseptoria tritici IPO323]
MSRQDYRSSTTATVPLPPAVCRLPAVAPFPALDLARAISDQLPIEDLHRLYDSGPVVGCVGESDGQAENYVVEFNRVVEEVVMEEEESLSRAGRTIVAGTGGNVGGDAAAAATARTMEDFEMKMQMMKNCPEVGDDGRMIFRTYALTSSPAKV